MREIDTVMLITSHLWTVYQVIKQTVNGKGGIKDKVTVETELMIGTMKRTRAFLEKVFKKICSLYQIPFTDLKPLKKFVGVFSQTLHSFMHSSFVCKKLCI